MATGSLKQYKKEADAQAAADFVVAKRAHDEKSEHRHFSGARYIKDSDSYLDGDFKAKTFSDEELDCVVSAIKTKTSKAIVGDDMVNPSDHDASICETLDYVVARIRVSKMESAVRNSIKAEKAARAKRRGEAS